MASVVPAGTAGGRNTVTGRVPIPWSSRHGVRLPSRRQGNLPKEQRVFGESWNEWCDEPPT